MPEPLSLAIKEISETRRLLEELITSSESFDYPKAKLALKELQRKERELAKVQARLEKVPGTRPNIQLVDFSGPSNLQPGAGL
jgi:hypothetical protein